MSTLRVSHSERSAGSLATEAQSKNPVAQPASEVLESAGILRLRSIPPSPAWNSAQNDIRVL